MEDHLEKKFLIRCLKCNTSRTSTGIAEDLVGLHEVKKCSGCGGPRVFRCPTCGGQMKMMRIRKC